MPRWGLIRKEIENVAQRARVTLIKLGILALHARNTAKFGSLNIEYLTPETTGGANLASLTGRAVTFWATVTQVVHHFTSILQQIISTKNTHRRRIYSTTNQAQKKTEETRGSSVENSIRYRYL